ncbi:glutamyl-tRNA reductase [Desulfobaculum bizertense]|uniref:Glutamyl-tRNA reductase n=1 Tax=Desulfobaculum bizertense DSM 18034 TaxID=1121442 RepID=A0A1T4W2Z1_9BACT|nr:glutamyl-tRNA reductase [Desulfobaculum bizertense]SKA71567.1 glutamyl-tRNA reductase [Desulfobaculum bizertense DSM 18034]
MNQKIYLIGLNHRTAGVEIREAYALKDCNTVELGLVKADGPVLEALTLSTCNRVEILAVTTPEANEEDILRFWASHCGGSVPQLKPHVYIHEGLAAVKHVFTVAASLDSMVVGEPQILGQLKDAYRKSIEYGSAKVIVNRVLHKAFSVAKRVRTETSIASSAVSISYAAVELAKKIFGDMSGNRAMLIGAGEMAELAATHLINTGIKELLVANRTFEHGEELARRMGGSAIMFEELQRKLADVDIIISSTGATDAIIRAKDLKAVLKKRRQRPMFFIDIAVPRDIDPDVNGLDNVYLYDIDDLKEVVEENIAQRREEAIKAETIIDSETRHFATWLESLQLNPTICDLLNSGEAIAAHELERTMKRLGTVSDEDYEALQTLVKSITHKLYHEPITFLKRRTQEEGSAQRFIDTTRRMFNLDHEDIPDNAHADRKRSNVVQLRANGGPDCSK